MSTLNYPGGGQRLNMLEDVMNARIDGRNQERENLDAMLRELDSKLIKYKKRYSLEYIRGFQECLRKVQKSLMKEIT